MGKTFRPERKDRKADHDKHGDHGVRQSTKDHAKTQEKKLLRHYEQHWQDLEDGD